MLRGITLETLAVLLITPLAAAAGTRPAEPVAPQPYHVMVVNDDGVDAPGIAALAAVLTADPSYRVTVVAPAEQQSGAGHSVITRGAIEVRAHAPVAGATAWAVAGTPATTARVGLAALLADDPPDLVLSGINRGENEGRLAWYSGTVGAAREALLAGFPAVAFSLQMNWSNPSPDWAAAGRWAKRMVDAVRENSLPDGVLLNVNIPRDPTHARGFRLARMDPSPSSVEGFKLVREEGGSRWYKSTWAPAPGGVADGDVVLLDAGWVTVTPLGIDQTAWTSFPALPWVTLLAGPQGSKAAAAAP